MKFREIFRFEFVYQVKRPWPWIFFTILLVLNFLMTRDATLSEALFEEFLVNSPFAIAKTTVFGNLLWLVMAAFITGDAAARDVYTRMHPLIYTLPIHKAQYLGGKFLAALILNALILIAVQLAIMLAIYAPGVDPAIIGPFSIAPYLTAYAYIGLPTAFAATCIQFAFAVATGKPIASYAGSVLLVFMGFFVASLLLFNRGLGTLLDPIGIRFVVEDMSHVWTTAEKNYRLVEFEGIILENRLLWIGIGLMFLAITYWGFRFKHRTGRDLKFKISNLKFKIFRSRIRTHAIDKKNWNDEVRMTSDESGPAILKSKISNLKSEFTPTSGPATRLLQTLTIAWSSFKTLAFSWAGLALLVGIPFLTILIVIDQMAINSGQLVPTTIRVINELTAPLSAELSRWVIIPAFIIFFAGELVWREREARLNEIIDTISGSEWAPLVGKFLGIGLVLVKFTTFQMAAGMLAQLALDYTDFETVLYIKILFGLQLPEYLLFAMLALTIHVVVDQKYMGHMVAIIAYVFIALSQLFGVDHNMLVFGAGPAWSYTDMRGFGNSIAPWLWFKLYWLAWTLLLAVTAKLLWVRGVQKSLPVRIKIARQQFTFATKIIAICSLALLLAVGGFVFHNTNVLNEYLTESEIKDRQAEYEHRYGKFKSTAQPKITDASLQIEIYTEQKKGTINGSYVLTNFDSVAIDSIHVAGSRPETRVTFGQKADLKLNDEKLDYSIYVLEKPIQPGDSLKLHFEMAVEPNGFRESGVNNAIVSNGTFFSNSWLPGIGYNATRELIHANDRRDYGLPARPIIASLYDTALRTHRGHGINFEAVIGTDENQTAGAPGLLVRNWKEKNRNYFHYKTDGPIGNEWSFFSANYSVREEKWKFSDSGKEVSIRIFHVPEHTSHLDRMIQSIRASLDYYTKNFGPYPYNHLTVAEGPGNGTGLHADASMLTHSEGFSLWNPENDSLGFDFPFAVVAHEIAHQWTVPYANVEGAPVMSESIAWYYAMKLVEKAKGPEHLKTLLHDMRQPHPYPPIRRGEPLLRGLDPYLSYRRGPFALYTLSEYVGENQVNEALRHLLESHRQADAPLATTLDLYHELESVTPDSLTYLLHDLFEVNTYWELETQKASAKKTDAGLWQIEFEFEAHKVVADSAGVETEIPMNDWIEVGIFANGSEPIYLQKHLVRSGKQTITVYVSQKPSRVGIDPNHLMIDLKLEDNFSVVTGI